MHWDLGIRKLWPEWRVLFTAKGWRSDLIAGLTVACVALPFSLAIALASEVPPEMGLRTAIVAGVICALLGGTRLAVSGPAAAMSLLVASTVESYGFSGLFAVGMIAGGLQILSGVFGFGSLVRFVPEPVVVGFTAGLGVLLIVGQLPRALGLPPPDQAHVIEVLRHLRDLIHWTQPAALLLALLSVAIMIGLPRTGWRIPAPLVAVVVPSLLAQIFHFEVPMLDLALSGSAPPPLGATASWGALLTTGFLVYALASIETLFSASAVDRLVKGEPHDPNQEVIGQGVGNIAVALCGGMPVTGLTIRSAVNVVAGARTRRAAILHSVALAVVALGFRPWLDRIPIPVLAGVLLSLAWTMVAPRQLWRISRASATDAVVGAVTVLLVVFADFLLGVQAGVILAFLFAALRLAQTRILEDREAKGGPVGFSISGALTFLSIRKLDALAHSLGHVAAGKSVVLDLSRLLYVDSSGALRLVNLVEQLRGRGVQVILKGHNPSIGRPLRAVDPAGEVQENFAVAEMDVLARLGGSRGDAARARLLSGVDRFQREFRGHYAPLFNRLGQEQRPHTFFITCADSRISPGLLTCCDPGELFVLRNVGNAIPAFGEPASEGAAVEYSVGVLGVNQIVVCGHSSCGAMKASVEGGDLSAFPSVERWIRFLRESLGLSSKTGGAEEKTAKTTDDWGRINVLRQAERLHTYPSVQAALARGELRISAWFFDVARGELLEYSEREKAFVPIASSAHRALEHDAATAANAETE